MGESSAVRRFALIALALTLALLVGVTGRAGARGAQAETGLVFRDQRPLSIESGKEKESRSAVVCNTSGAVASDLTWSLSGFQFRKGDTDVAQESVVSLGGGPPRLPAGACHSVTIDVIANPNIDPGPFDGVLVVTSAGAGAARLEVSVAGPASTVVSTKGAAETITLTATKWKPWSETVSVDGDSALALQAPAPGKSLDLAPPGAFIGNLVNAGDVASVYVSGDPDKRSKGVWLLPIEVRGVASVGEYEGTLMPTATADEKQTVKANVKVTVGWPWALLTVILGAVLLVVLPTLYFRRWRVKETLHKQYESLAESYAKAGEELHWLFPKLRRLESPPETQIGDYTAAVDAAIRAYAESTWYFDANSDAYAKIVKSLDAADADVRCLEGQEGLGKALTELEETLERLAKGLKAHLPIDRQPAIALAASAMLAGGRLTVGEATTRARKAAEFGAGIDQWTELAQALRRYEVWHRVLDELTPSTSSVNFEADDFATLKTINSGIAVAKNELLEASGAEQVERLAIQKRLSDVYGQLSVLGAKYKRWVVSEPAPAGAKGAWPELKLEIDGESQEIPATVQGKIAEIQRQLPSEVNDTDAWRKNADLLLTVGATPVELGTTKRFVGDALVLLLSVATGTVASLSAFYFGKTWGTAEDFLTVFFVGTAAQAFLKPVTDALAQLRGGVDPVTKSEPETAVLETVAKAVGETT